MRGWKTNAATAANWRVGGERLHRKGGAEGTLWNEGTFGDAEWIVDCKPAKPGENGPQQPPAVRLRGAGPAGFKVELGGAEPDRYQRFSITLRGRGVIVRRDEQEIQRLELPEAAPARGGFGLDALGTPAEFMNLYAREL